MQSKAVRAKETFKKKKKESEREREREREVHRSCQSRCLRFGALFRWPPWIAIRRIAKQWHCRQWEWRQDSAKVLQIFHLLLFWQKKASSVYSEGRIWPTKFEISILEFLNLNIGGRRDFSIISRKRVSIFDHCDHRRRIEIVPLFWLRMRNNESNFSNSSTMKYTHVVSSAISFLELIIFKRPHVPLSRYSACILLTDHEFPGLRSRSNFPPAVVREASKELIKIFN